MSARAAVDQSNFSHIQRTRQVWLVLFCSFAAFLGLCALLGVGVSGLLGGITDPRPATLKAVPPSVLAVQRHNAAAVEFITGTTTLQEGDIATTGKNDQAFISLFGDSGSVQMYFNSRIEMSTMRTSRFFQNTKEIAVTLDAGTATFATGNSGDYSSASYTLSTNQGEVDVSPGSNLRARVTDEQGTFVTEIVVNAGHATLRSHSKRIDIGGGEMATVSGADVPVGPTLAQEDLIRNGTFEEPPTSNIEEVSEGGLGTAAWLPLRDDTGVPSPPASVGITDEVNLKAAVIDGLGAPDRYVRVGIAQDINQPASFYSTIELSATIKVVRQAVPAGGPANDVYPLIIRVVYTDQFGKNHDWKRAFYYQGRDPDLTDSSVVKITQGRWTTTQEMQEERSNALKSTGPANTALFVLKSPSQLQDIAVINAIEIYGYGTQFQSWITGISLMAR